jgi:hypothetical protein
MVLAMFLKRVFPAESAAAVLTLEPFLFVMRLLVSFAIGSIPKTLGASVLRAAMWFETSMFRGMFSQLVGP